MKSYTDKELATMSQEELKALQEKALKENERLGEAVKYSVSMGMKPSR